MSNPIFGNLKTEGMEEAQDRLATGRTKDTDIYSATLKMLYAGKSKDGAANVTVVADLVDSNGVKAGEYRETIYVTNKKGENWFLDKQDATKKHPMPGFTTIDDICQMTIGKPLNELVATDKVVEVYDFDAKKEVPTSVPMFMEPLGKTVFLAIQRSTVNKQKRNNAGAYEDTAEFRDENNIVKVFHDPSKMTMSEAKAKKPAEFFGKWLERNKGNTWDKRTIKDGGTSGKPGSRPSTPPKAGDSKASSASLFA